LKNMTTAFGRKIRFRGGENGKMGLKLGGKVGKGKSDINRIVVRLD